MFSRPHASFDVSFRQVSDSDVSGNCCEEEGGDDRMVNPSPINFECELYVKHDFVVLMILFWCLSSFLVDAIFFFL